MKSAPRRGPDREEAHHLTRLLDWLLPLPVAAQQVWGEVRAFDKENAMPFLSYPEQIGLEKGLEKGLEQGRKEGLLKGIALGLKGFGEDGPAVLAAAGKMSDTALLEAILAALLEGKDLDEVRRLLPSS